MGARYKSQLGTLSYQCTNTKKSDFRIHLTWFSKQSKFSGEATFSRNATDYLTNFTWKTGQISTYKAFSSFGIYSFTIYWKLQQERERERDRQTEKRKRKRTTEQKSALLPEKKKQKTVSECVPNIGYLVLALLCPFNRTWSCNDESQWYSKFFYTCSKRKAPNHKQKAGC